MMLPDITTKVKGLLRLKTNNVPAEPEPTASEQPSPTLQTGTTASSLTDVTGQATWTADPEKAELARVATCVGGDNTQATESDSEKQDAPKSSWPLWKKLAIAGCILAVLIGLGVGLGVGLTRHSSNHNHNGNGNGNDSSSPNNGGSGGGQSHKPGKLSVYWGAKLNTISLDEVCSDPSYDIVNLAFLSYFYADGQYPRLAIPSLNGSSEAQKTAGALALQDGTALVPAIKKCQASGKLVLLSMGGAAGYADVRLNSDAQGEQVADTIWNLFLAGGKNRDLRPFGDVVLDGVDFDNESDQSTGYGALARRLRSHFAEDTYRRYYMTAAPQCPFPENDDMFEVYEHLDYVSVQFYNNNVCNVGQSGFEASVKRWSQAIGNTTLLVGGLASDADGDEGYVDAKTFVSVMGRIKAMNLPNYGGVMLWEAELAAQNGQYQKKIKPHV